jgi:hypothetical protein
MILFHIILCLIGAAYSKAQMDYIADSGEKSREWKNKYKLINGELQKPKNHWWYFNMYKPKYQERFPYSTTILAFTTDRWHWWQFAMLRYFYLAIAHAFSDNGWCQLLLTFIIFPIVLGVVFEIVYTIKRKK